MAISNMHEKFGKFGKNRGVVWELCSWTDRQTHAHRCAHYNTSPPLLQVK